MPVPGIGTIPSHKDCGTAIKVLTEYGRLASKLQIRLPSKRVEELNRRRDAGTITVADVPATLRREWPGGVFDDKTLDEIRELCGRKRRQ